MTEEMEKEIEREIKLIEWRANVSGRIEGALDVLFLLDRSREESISLFSRACGLSTMTATEMYDKEVKKRQDSWTN